MRCVAVVPKPHFFRELTADLLALQKQLHRWDSITSVVKKSVSSMGSVKAKKVRS